MQPRVTGVVIFEADSHKRIIARYFDAALPNYARQIQFEKALITKAVKSCSSLETASMAAASGEKGKDSSVSNSRSETTEIILIEDFFVILRIVNDVLLAVIARENQNDLLMAEYMSTLHNCLHSILANNVCKKKVQERLDQVLLVIDESLERGFFFELDAPTIVSRINMMDLLNEGGVSTPSSSAASTSIAATAVRDGIAAISRGDTDSLRSVFAGAAQKFSNLLGR